MWTVSWTFTGEDHEQPLATLAELEVLLDRLHARYAADSTPRLVWIKSHERACELIVGLGGSRSVLMVSDETLPDLSFTSLGTDRRDREATFVSSHEPSVFPYRYLVPVSDAREAVRQFCRTHQRPDAVGWTPD